MRIKRIAVIILIISIALTLASCSDKTVSDIRVSDSTPVPTTFSPDDPFPETSIEVIYSDGSREIVQVKDSMIRGFDTSLSCVEPKEYTITYGGASLKGSYTVDGEVNTRIRLSAEVSSVEGKQVVTVSITDTQEDGMVALKGEISFFDILIEDIELKPCSDSIELVSRRKDGSVSFVLYSTDGIIRDTTELFKIIVTSASDADVSLTIGGDNGYYIELSEGDGILLAPSVKVSL